jgi:hypothetical protein
MSFVLPGNARSLRFSGEAPAAESDDAPPPSLGKPRVRKPSSVPPSIGGRKPRGVMNTPVSTRDVLSTPYGAPSGRGPVVRHKLDLDTDGDPTRAMDREGMPPSARYPDRIPASARVPQFPRTARVPTPPGSDAATIARSSSVSSPQFAPYPPPIVVAAPVPRGAPYMVWILASILAGIVSYHLAPEIVTRIEAARSMPTSSP